MKEDDFSYSKNFQCIVDGYKALYKESKETESDEGTILIFQGSITEVLFGVEGINTGNYGHVSKRLQEMGCIEFISRGGGGQPSTIRLHFAPNYQQYTIHKNRKVKDKNREYLQMFAALEQRIHSLEVRLNKLDGRVAQPMDSFDD